MNKYKMYKPLESADSSYPMKCRLLGHKISYLVGRNLKYFSDVETCERCQYWETLPKDHPALVGVEHDTHDYSSEEVLKKWGR